MIDNHGLTGIGFGGLTIGAPVVVRFHQLLAQVYCWFTEGFDIADLQEEGSAGGVGGITQGESSTAATFRPMPSPQTAWTSPFPGLPPTFSPSPML
jgi:hypothetical protein